MTQALTGPSLHAEKTPTFLTSCHSLTYDRTVVLTYSNPTGSPKQFDLVLEAGHLPADKRHGDQTCSEELVPEIL